MRDYQRELEAVTARLGEARPRLLLHSCCGPCSSYCLEYLTRWFRVDVLFYNPNILPEEEFHRRLYWQRRLLETGALWPGGRASGPAPGRGGLPAAARGLEREPEGGTRCTACFRLRLERTARPGPGRGLRVLYHYPDRVPP